jgi:hypothetical protein
MVRTCFPGGRTLITGHCVRNQITSELESCVRTSVDVSGTRRIVQRSAAAVVVEVSIGDQPDEVEDIILQCRDVAPSSLCLFRAAQIV